jgi:drug/metabolite transporter (DMT)-like permease
MHHSEPPKPMQKFINFLSLAIFTTALAAGQVMFKQVGLTIRGRPPLDSAADILSHRAFYFALCLYAFATFLWIWILSRVPLSQAYPWVAIGIAIVPLLGCYIFGERIKPAFWLGVLLILSGVIITQLTSQSS